MLSIETTPPILESLLGGRYKIVQTQSFGVLGRTYIAQDMHRPGNPKCIIKHLKLASDDPNCWQSVKRLFFKEAQILENLGQHDQIPQVLACFEDDQGFYIAQDFIEGHPLSNFLPTSPFCGKRWTEDQAIQLLQDVLGILEFIHRQNIIHCNINPNNIIQRASDGKLFLIDFGAVQPIQTSAPIAPAQQSFTFNLNPAGYIPPEQLVFQPCPSSDIYALGAIAIQALTGLHPSQLQVDSKKKNWQQEVSVSNGLAAILNQMVQPFYKDRYQSATEVLQALQSLTTKTQESQNIFPLLPLTVGEEREEERSLSLLIHSSTIAANIPVQAVQLEADTPFYPLRLSPWLVTFGFMGIVSIAANALIIKIGLEDIQQPDPSKYQLAEKIISEYQLPTAAERLCEIPYICFWRGTPLTDVEVQELIQNAYIHAYQDDFSAALKTLEKIPPGSPRYEFAKAKIAEYKHKRAIKLSGLKMNAKSNSRSQSNRQ